MPEDEVKKILEDMEKHGFPLEAKASEILKAHKWEITNQMAYLDSEERRFRTVDIVAEGNVRVTPSFGLWLIIVCFKKPTNSKVSSRTSLSSLPMDFWNCRVHHWN